MNHIKKNILFIGNYKSPLAKERYEIICKNINNNSSIFFDTGSNKLNKEHYASLNNYKNNYVNAILQFFYCLYIIYTKKINIIHIHGGFQVFINFLSLCVSKKVKFIVTVQGSEINQHYKGYKKVFVNYLLNNSDIITVKSAFMRTTVSKIINSHTDIVNLNWGIDDILFSSTNKIRKNVIKIISFRATDYLYNIDSIFEAIKDIKKIYKNVEFTYIEFNKNDSISLDLSLVDRYEKNLNKEKLYNILREQDIMISIPKYDGFATSLMESLALGIYPIISDIESYNDENLKEQVSMVNLEDKNSLKDELKNSIKNIDSIKNKKLERINFSKVNYSKINQIEILKNIYKDL